MKTMSERIRRRMDPGRKMTAISIRIPEDVIEDLKEVAEFLEYSGYQALLRTYVSEGLRADLARLEQDRLRHEVVGKLLEHGVAEEVIQAAVPDVLWPHVSDDDAAWNETPGTGIQTGEATHA